MDYANIILEMLDRIKKLENEVAELKNNSNKNSINNSRIEETTTEPKKRKRDTTRYLFNRNVYLKNRLVLAVVHDYIKENPTITCEQLQTVFHKSLQGSMGVVETVEKARIRSNYTVRFFTEENEIIHLNDGDMYVCSQWGILNIPNFLKHAATLGYTIDPI